MQQRVEQGDLNFIAMWEQLGGKAHLDARRAWFAEHAGTFRRALGIA